MTMGEREIFVLVTVTCDMHHSVVERILDQCTMYNINSNRHIFYRVHKYLSFYVK